MEGDVFVDVHAHTGRLSDRGLDLPLALALASAARDVPIDAGVASCGKLALTGEVLPPRLLDARCAEMRRLGFVDPVVPRGGDEDECAVATIGEVIEIALQLHTNGAAA